MKKQNTLLAACAATLLTLLCPTLVSSSCVPQSPTENDTLVRPHDTGLNAMQYSCPAVPRQVEFCGQTIDLTRFDRHERMDRELLAFAYMHSTSLQMIKKANRYFPVVEPILKKNGVPDDFKYLMVIESNLNPQARSRAGAAGLWQFMQGTGRDYGLEVNKNIDERYHVEKATQAACEYLKDAYRKYNDWVAVAASYNAGQARIARQLDRQYVDDSLDLLLVEETARYVYRILAAKILFSDPTAFGFRLRASDLYTPIPYTEVSVNHGISDLIAFARSKGTTLALLKMLNPWLRESSLMNQSRRTYVLHIPTPEGLTYDPQKLVPHDRRWVVE